MVKGDSSMRNPGTKPNIPDSSAASRKATAKKSSGVVKDSARLAIEKMPSTALKRSLMIPGWGQLYNIQIRKGKKQPFRYIKIPAIYGGYVALGLIYNYDQYWYRKTLHELQYRLANSDQKRDPDLFVITQRSSLISVKDNFRRDRDLCILGFLFFHTIQSIEAYTDAKLFRYDIGDNLSMKIAPSVIQNGPPTQGFSLNTPAPAMKLSLSFK
ncbi:DUF5683 domain-containing protein [Hufsiella ginkgonis]|uniref:DUF5683 domain-containing protein n=1 Tax=Hufsiella ginkgonis TaxID=2695274 RepID=A0A7K1Y177_9SPHI|nr:DUF5683 domain-containing protein [Hufsiella ginkgonis]MXV17004.1 hypothetical protein [Hufsiella ginkgonis]